MSAIDFYYDVVCPYAYLASVQVEAVARRCGATVRWRPILLGGLLRAVGAPDDPNAALGPAKRALLRRDRARWAALLGVPLHEPAQHPRRTVDAMRLCLAAPEGPVRQAVSRELFEAYWVRGQDVADRAELAAVARRHGLAGDAFAAAPVR
ncbi:MAG: DsbA family protein, partial [Myxococcales bacterium]|nr:DsbA family protein [Myxococcales bacterium]